MAATADQRADHARDLRKHDPLPSDVPSALTIAKLARSIDEADAVALIQKYADTVASVRTERAVSDANKRLIGLIEGAFKPAKDAEVVS